MEQGQLMKLTNVGNLCLVRYERTPKRPKTDSLSNLLPKVLGGS